MSKGQTLRALLNERLAAAAEDIFVLFERTITEYEEELCHSKEENHRKRQLLDQSDGRVQNPTFRLVRGNYQSPSTSPGPGLNQEIPESPQIKEEPEEESIKQEEEQLPVYVSESSGVCVKTEESLMLQQRQTELREEPEDISSETEGHTDNDDDWGALLSYSAAQMETEAEGDHYNQVQIRDRSSTLSSQNQSAPQTSVHSEDVSGADEAERKKHQCRVCNTGFGNMQDLQRHFTVHSGKKLYHCSMCEESFSYKSSLETHKRTHTPEKLYNCAYCKKYFLKPSKLRRHERIHTREKPYCCSTCGKSFSQSCNLDTHRRTHTGEKPYSCSTCGKTFAQKSSLNSHIRTHTIEKPYSCSTCMRHFADPSAFARHKQQHTRARPHTCSVCNKTFALKHHLNVHTRIHTGERPYICAACGKTFTQPSALNTHMGTHNRDGITP